MPTTPGLHPEFMIWAYPNEIRAAIRKISQTFYVTRGFKPVQIGNSQYWAVLVRPTDTFSVYINTDREVIVLFSYYDTLEIRTLEAYEEIYSLLETSRVDRSVRFLVSNDVRVESIVKHYLDQHPEYPIIIPTTYRELAADRGDPLLDAVRRNYLLRDLFGYQNPLREETFFFGRQQVVNSVLDMAKSGQNSSLFGLRKSGKTSAIYAIQRKSRGFGISVAVVDCQNPAVHARRYGSLLSYVLGEVRKAIGPRKPLPELGSSLSEIAENFGNYMNNLLSIAKSHILIIFDEIENISPSTAASPHWRTENDTVYFWQTVRSYIQSESKGRLSVCIVGTSPHVLEMSKINDIDNPIYLYAQKKFIPSLTFDDTKEMVVRLGYFMGLEFPPNIIADLHSEFGGHPFFTRQVCSKIHQLASPQRPLVVSSAALQKAKKEFSGQLDSYMRDIINDIKSRYPDEYYILKAVVTSDANELSEYGREAPDLIDHLIGYGLVTRVQDDFEIRFSAIKTALVNMIVAEGGRDYWLECSNRRNKIESDIKISLFHWSRGLGQEAWAAIVDESLTNRRRLALASVEPTHLFSSKESPLYLTDLLGILKNEAVLPYLADRKSEILRHLDTVNKLRKDAHANIIAADEMQELRTSFDYLETQFSAP